MEDERGLLLCIFYMKCVWKGKKIEIKHNVKLKQLNYILKLKLNLLTMTISIKCGFHRKCDSLIKM